jgi:hypothetical protein
MFSIILFYLDNFKLSSNYLIKYLQKFCFIFFPIIIILIVFNTIYNIDIICYLDDKDGVNLHGHVNVIKDAAKELSKGMSVIGSQIGLGATIVGVSAAVGKAITKASVPPIHKAGIILGSAVIAGVSHSTISKVNREDINHINNLNVDVKKLVDTFFPLQDLLFNFQILSYTCLTLVYLLILQIIFKFYVKNYIKLGLSSLVGIKINNTLEYYLNKIIFLNKKINNVYMLILFISLILGLSSIAYASDVLYNNLDSNIFFAIQDSLFNIKILSYIGLNVLFFLIMQIISKIYVKENIKINLSSLIGIKINNTLEYYLNKIIMLNKKMNNLYMGILLIILIIVLASIGYISSELYNNLGNYINADNFFQKKT